MHVDFLIIGQGISGTFLYHELVKSGYRVLVIDEQRKNSASQVASGVINLSFQNTFDPQKPLINAFL